MSSETPTVVLVHGAFAESASWSGVIGRLAGHPTIAVANPLRGVASDGRYVRDVVAGLDRPVILVGHSYGGMVITEAASDNPAVKALVYVSAFAPEPGENAFLLSGKFEGSSLGSAVDSYPLSSGGNELRITAEKYPHQFCADVEPRLAAIMAVTQRAVTERALNEGLSGSSAAWAAVPSWFIWGEKDLNIPAELVRFMGERAGARECREVAGASHALSVSQPVAVTETILSAVAHVQR